MNEIDINADREPLIEETLKELEYYKVLEIIRRYCYSDIGIEKIINSYPSEDIDWLRNEHQNISEMVELLSEDKQLPLDGLSDIRQYLYKSLVENAVLLPTELLAVRDGIRVSRMLQNYFHQREEKYPGLAEWASQLHENRLFEKHIADAIDDSGEVKDRATKELFRIRRAINEKSNRLRNRLKKILKRVVEEDMVMEDFVTLREGRFVLPVKSEHKRHIPGIIYGISQTGSTVFIEPSEIIEMNNELSLLINDEKREIYKILSNLTSELGREANLFLESIDIIGNFDAVIAKAKYALECGGLKPEILDESLIYLNNIRHPLLVHTKKIKDVIPLNVEFTSKKRGWLISGPNAGGKTVALKSIGVNVAMALSGIFPLGECRTNVRTIFSSIGDRQSIENDLSTFSSQILQIRDILSNCTRQSLILIDEIGSGTDPQEGAALASGILDSFINLNLFFVATTHQSSLKTYALSREEIENASLEFDENELKPTYKFLPEIPGNSYAFALSKSLGLPAIVLERAKKYLGSRQKELEESIAALQKYRAEAEKERTKAVEEREKAQAVKDKYMVKFDDIKRKRLEYISKAKEEAMEIIANANSLIENTIREIREEKRPVASIKKDFSRKKADIQKNIEEQEKMPKKAIDFKIGDTVSLMDSSSIGSIIELDKKSSIAVVDVNGLKFKISLQQLEKVKVKSDKKEKQSYYIKYDIKTNIDLRGMRAEEALRQVDSFISDAHVSNAKTLTLIHGKGTGALRQAIHQFLDYHQSVESFRLGELVEGGAGVTIVELR